MTSSQLQIIRELRHRNYSYRFIGEKLSLSQNTVKSICRRKGFDAIGPRKTKADKACARLCKNCSRPFSEDARKDAMFCSEDCRIMWWNDKRKVIKK